MNSYGLADHSPPPSDLDAEASVLGAVMLAEKWLDSYEVGGLVPDDFYRPRNQLIFRAIKSLRSTNDPIDHVTVAARLDRVGEIENVGRDYVTSLVHHIANIGNTKAYATVIKENSLLRKLLQAGWEIERLVHEREGEPLELVERSLALVGEIGLPVGERAYGPDDLMDLAVAHFSNERPTEVFPLSLPALNEATNGGLRRGQVMALAGWPNEGKSALAMDFLESAIKGTDRKARIYLTEMTVEEINHRIIARQSKLTINQIIRNELTLDQHRQLANLKMPNLTIQPASGWTVDQICNDILRHRPDIVLVDHFHRINFHGARNKVDAMDEASAKLNSVAKDNQANCVLLLVAHLSRPNTDKETVPPRPTGRHLRGTQMLEADADIVCMVYRDRDKATLAKEPGAEVYFIRNRAGDPDAKSRANFNWRNLRFDPPIEELKL